MKKILTSLVLLLLVFITTTGNTLTSGEKQRQSIARLKKALPDSAFTKIRPGNLLDESLYLRLAKEGWTTKEIFTITDDYLAANRNKVKGSFSYVAYAKEWKPYWYMLAPNDTIKRQVDPVYTESVNKAYSKAIKAAADEYNPRIFYTPADRMNGVRNKGYFRHNAIMPSVGRINWIQANEKDSSKLMVIPDGDGIWRTDNSGRTWDPVTDRIPNRLHRSSASDQFCIPVDPDDWNHFFAFMDGTTKPVYETTDGGQSWNLVTGATSKQFKKGFAFKDVAGNLKFIGVERSLYTTWDGKLWISENKGVLWRQVVIPGTRNWLQEFAFDPIDRNLIYVTTGLGIWRSTDGFTYTNNKYSLEQMKFKVYNRDKTILRSDTTLFPFPIGDGPLILRIDPKNTSKMWAALGSKSNFNSALYYSEDKGLTWITLTDTYGFSYFSTTKTPIGSGQVFGNEAPGGWLGDFAVNFTDPKYLYGCTMSSAKSLDGGYNFSEFAWGYQMKGLHPDGKFYTVSSSRHNADNHTMSNTESGRVFRGSDAGMLMVDKKVNGNEWTNISGNMGQLLIYKARVNEFGDQTFIANTQDNDAQTYRYGRWGWWRGYEGSCAAINPMSNETYFSGGGGGSMEGTDWGNSWKEGFGKADVVTGNWYLWRSDRMIGSGTTLSDFGVVRDLGRSVSPLFTNTANKAMSNRDFAICRDTTVGSSLLVLRTDGNIVRFDNESSTYTTITRPTFTGYTGSCITVNPDNVKEIYVADNTNGILKTTNGGTTWTKISTGTGGITTGVTFNNLYYHEGSGDLYAISNGYGIYLKTANSTSWVLWMKGYNPAAFGGAQICYTTQEMMIFDYGRGLWLADLENPADRFFKDGFKIKQLSNINGVRTFGMDTKLDIPLYHNYQWYINGQPASGTQYRTFSSSALNATDKVQLKLTLREAPDVVTTSSLLTVGTDATQTVAFTAGNAIKSVGTGRIDLGHRNFFGDDFTVEMWVKPAATDNSTLIGNRKLDSRDQQGWTLGLVGGNLKFKYAPRSIFNQPSYESTIIQEADLSAGAITANAWSHIAVTVQRNGYVKIYVNGVQKISATRIIPESGLNSVQPLSLLADGYEYNPANAMIDELRIWKKALTIQDIRSKMCAQPSVADSDLVYYNDFNAATTETQKETFSRTGMRSRIRAEVTYPEMPMAVCANQAKYDTIKSVAKDISNSAGKLLSARILAAKTSPASIYRFDNVYTASTIRGMTTEHHDVAPYTYKIDLFGTFTATDSVELRFFIPNAANFNGESIYMVSADKDQAIWAEKVKAKYDETDGSIVGRFKATEVNGQLLAIIKSKPAIVLTVPSASTSGIVPVYRENQTSLPFTAGLLKLMPAPTTAYSLTTSRAFAQANPLDFGSNTTASSTMTFDTDSLSSFNKSTSVVLSGMDSRMIPYEVFLQNKIAPVSQGTSLKFTSGGATVGSASNYAALNNSNTISMSAWVRFDDTLMVSPTNTTVRPVLFFRGGGYTTGLHLYQGELRCHWNEESWSWGLATGLKLTKADVGKWVHLAMVTTPTSITYYMNGRKFTSTRTMTKTHIVSPLMLGRNADGDTWFNGAFDQVQVWNRSLTEAEIMKYMHERVYNDETGLVASINMDARNESGTLVEMRSNAVVAVGGTVEQNHRSAFPYANLKQTAHTGTAVTSSTDLVSVKMPAGLSGTYYLTQYDHLPYNYAISGLPPVYKGFFTVSYVNAQTFSTATDSITFICRQPSIQMGDPMQLVIRELGKETVFVSKATTNATANGYASCKIKASLLTTAFEAMWVTTTSNMQTISLGVENATDLNKVILKDNEIAIPVVIERTSTRTGGKIDLIVKESTYARFENPEIDLTVNPKVTLPLIIDRDKINPYAYNNIQISFIGAAGSLLNFKFALEPSALLTLVNGTAADKITATGSTVTLNVEAKLVQGVLDEPIKLDVTGDMNNAVSIGTGYLTVNGNAKYKNLDYKAAENSLNAGWNLVSNPYLVSMLLSKQENRTLDNVSVYFYQYNPTAKTFMAYDTRYFDSNMWLKPLEPFFVQAKEANASLELNASGKNRTYNRRNTAFFALSEVQEVGLELWSSDILFDRTAVRLDNSADAGYVYDEDAPKMLSFDTTTPQLYTISDDDKLSINAVPSTVTEIPIGLKTSRTGTYTFRVNKATHAAKTIVEFIDVTDNKTIVLRETGDLYSFSLNTAAGTVENRFKLRFTITNDINDAKEFGVNVWVEYNNCHIDGLKPGTRVSLYDASGKKVIDQIAQKANWTTKLPAGIYMINLNSDSKEYKGKVIIN